MAWICQNCLKYGNNCDKSFPVRSDSCRCSSCGSYPNNLTCHNCLKNKEQCNCNKERR